MNIHNARHEATAVHPKQYPVKGLPEVAFVGRSNVGKSSLINSLLNRRNLARVGATPGKTREIHFYNIDEAMFLVDLPGYGYANVSKEQKGAWQGIIEGYLNHREELKLIVLLVDIRHKPTEDDRIMHQWLMESQLPYAVVTTKADKINRSQMMARLKEIRTELGMGEHISVIPYSSEKGTGREELWKVIQKGAFKETDH